MTPTPRTGRRDDRAVSNQVAVVLLIGVVITGSVVVGLVGTESLTELKQQVQGESSEKTMREVDARVSSLAIESSRTQTTLDFGDQSSGDIHVSHRGFVNVSVNRRVDCSANVSLSSVRVDRGGGDVRAYEMGGIWVRNDGGSAMTSPPQLRYDDGGISLTVTNFSGTINEQQEVIRRNITATDDANSRIRRTLQHEECARPDNVTVTVRSDFHEAYYSYMRGEFDYTSIDHYAGNRTVRVYLNQSKLPRTTNDSANQVVNLSGAPYHDLEVTDNSVAVQKNASVNYSFAMRPVATGVDVQEVHDFEDQTIYREPIDVVFVVDESGSMDYSAASGDPKYEETREAMRTFLGQLNGSRDRAALVGFYENTDRWAHYYLTDGDYLTNDFSEMNDTFDGTEHDGGTNISAGVEYAERLLDLKSNDSRKKVVIVLTDGENTAYDYDVDGDGWDEDLDDGTEYWADQSAESGADVYTIGFGSDPGDVDRDLLEDMTNSSGGRYYFAENGTELDQVFRDIARQVTSTKAIARPPVSVNVTTANHSYYPQISGNASYVANATGRNNSAVKNVNDPTAPEFSFALTVPDGANVSMTSVSYSCQRWEATDQVVVNDSTNESYIVTRCSDLNESSRERLQPSNVSVYTDGDNVSALVSQREAWFQEDLNASLEPYKNGTTLTLPSNQAIVVFDYEDDDKADKRIVMLLQMGYAESQRSTDSVVQMRVNNVTIKD